MRHTSRQGVRWAPIAGLVAIAGAVGTVSELPAVSAGAAGNQPTVSAQTIGRMGKILVVKGRAAYTLSPAGSPCDAACLKVWPAVTVPASVSTVSASSGVQHSSLGVTTGPGGTHQITYDGQPLFWFFKDKKGTVKGDLTDQWGKWTAVVVSKAKHGSSGSGSGGGSSTTTTTSGGANAGGGGVNF